MEIDVKTTHVVEIETGIPMSNNNTDNYNSLTNKPKINGITLSENKTAEELGLASKKDVEELSNNKVDKEYGKGLSTNDFTNEDKDKLSGLQNYDDTEIKELINGKQDEGDYATKDYVEQEIANFDFIKIVTKLPETGLVNRTYFVPKTDTETNDLYDEYMWVDDKWELIGTKQIEVDLTDYADKKYVDTAIGDINTALQNLVSGGGVQ